MTEMHYMEGMGVLFFKKLNCRARIGVFLAKMFLYCVYNQKNEVEAWSAKSIPSASFEWLLLRALFIPVSAVLLGTVFLGEQRELKQSRQVNKTGSWEGL